MQLLMLIDAAVHTVSPEPFGKLPDAIHVFLAIVAVADENSEWHVLAHNSLNCLPLQSQFGT
jgi:hypothetical protein